MTTPFFSLAAVLILAASCISPTGRDIQHNSLQEQRLRRLGQDILADSGAVEASASLRFLED
jgi:hypothetical protein